MTRKLPLALAFAALLGGCGATLEEAKIDGDHPFPTRVETAGSHLHPVHGVDVAKYQGDIDWQALRASGVRFAFIKATEGSDRLDDRFHHNWAAAKAAGIARGAYHFNYWCSPIENQIEWYKRHVPVDPDALPPVLDLEWNPQSPTCPKRVPREVALPQIRKFLVAMERHYGKRPIIYTDSHFYRDILSGGELAEYPFWLSNMRGLPQEKFPGRRWAFWQYTFKGRVPGVRGDVDRNVFAGTPQQWHALASAGFTGAGAGGSVAVAAAEAPAAGSQSAGALPPQAPLPPPRPDTPVEVATQPGEADGE